MTIPDDDYAELGRALAAMRRRRGLTQAQVAEKVGIRNTHVSGIEIGERGASYPTILAMLRVYRSSLKELAEEIERGGGG
jgi:transcriptional regulator with XRE-family HTH domain